MLCSIYLDRLDCLATAVANPAVAYDAKYTSDDFLLGLNMLASIDSCADMHCPVSKLCCSHIQC